MAGRVLCSSQNLTTRSVSEHPGGHAEGAALPTPTHCISQFSKHGMWKTAAPEAQQHLRQVLPQDGFGRRLVPAHTLQGHCKGLQVGLEAVGLQNGKQSVDAIQAALQVRREGAVDTEKGRRLWTLTPAAPKSHAPLLLFRFVMSTPPLPLSLLPLKATSHRSVASCQLSPPRQKHCLSTC